MSAIITYPTFNPSMLKSTHATIFVASSSATTRQKMSADYVCTGTADDVFFNAAILARDHVKIEAVGSPFNLASHIAILNQHIAIDFNRALVNFPDIGFPNGAMAVSVGYGSGVTITAGWSSGAPTFTLPNALNIPLYGWSNGAGLYLSPQSGAALPTGYSASTQYFVVNLNVPNQTFQLSLTQGGSPVVATGAGNGNLTIAYAFFTYNSSTNILTVTGTNPPVFPDSSIVGVDSVGGTLPNGLPGVPTMLYTKRVSGNTYALWKDPYFGQQATASNAGSGPLSIIPYTLSSEVTGMQLELDVGGNNNGIFLTNTQNNTEVHNVQTFQGFQPMLVGGGDNANIHDNYFYYPYGNGINLVGNRVGTRVRNNVVAWGTYNGIHAVAAGVGDLIDGNYATSNVLSGIQMSGTCTRFRVTGNLVENNSQPGTSLGIGVTPCYEIAIDPGLTSGVVSDNQILVGSGSLGSIGYGGSGVVIRNP